MDILSLNPITPLIVDLNGNWVPIIQCIFIIFLILELFSILRHYNGLNRIERHIKFLKKNNDNPSFTIRGPQNIWFSKYFIGNYDNNKAWKPRTRQQHYLLTSYPTALTIRARSPVSFGPGLLTTLGILGTFVGISQGMPEQMQFGASKDLMDVSSTLLGGMKTAFNTSLVGLACAAILTITQALTNLIKNSRRRLIYSKLEKISFLETSTSLLAQVNQNNQQEAVETQKQVAQAMLYSVQELKSTSNSMREGINKFDPSVIGDKVSEGIQNVFAEQLTPVFSEIRDELRQLREIKEDNGQEILKELISQLRTEVLEPMSERIDQSTQTTERAAHAVEQLHRELGGIAKELSGTVTQMQSFQMETMQQLRGFSTEMRGILTQFQDDTRTTLESIGKSINSALDKSIEGMAFQREAFETSAQQASATFRGIREELQEAMSQISREIKSAIDQSIEGMGHQRNAFESSAKQAADTFHGIREELEQSLIKRSEIEKQALNETRDGINHILHEAQNTFAEQSQTLNSVGEHAANLMDSAQLKLTNTLTNIDTVLAKSTEMVKEQLETFRIEYQHNLTSFFEEQNLLLEGTLGQQREGLSQVVQSLDTVFQEEYERRIEITKQIEDQFFSLQESAKIIQELVEATGMSKAAHWDQLNDATQSLGSQINQLESQYSHANERFVTMVDQIPKELGDYLEISKQSQIEFCKDLDIAASKVHNTLAAAAEYLVAAEQDRRLHQS